MKKYILLAVVVLLLSNAASAQYFVTKVAGKVKDQEGNTIRPGLKLTGSETLTWSAAKDRLWVVITGSGERIISPSANAAQRDNTFKEVLSASTQQVSPYGSLSSRAEIIEKIPDALRADAKSNGKIVIEQENKYLFDPKIYPQTNGSTFFVEIDIPLEKPIIRKLKSIGDTVYINYTDLITETVNASIKYSLGYFDKAAGKSQLVISFNPYFDVTNEMEAIVANSTLAYIGSNETKESVRDSIYQSVYATSGKPNGILFTSLFNKYWDNKGIIEVKEGEQSTGGVYDAESFASVSQLSPSVKVTRSDLPDNFSLKAYAPPIGYQGKFGSCTAWATAYATRTIAYAVKHNYSVNNQYDKIVANTFAPDFIYNNIKSTPDCSMGTYIPVALKWMVDKGNIIRLSELFICGKTYATNEFDAAQNYKIKDFVRLNGNNIKKTDLVFKMKSMLAGKHALPFGMSMPPSFRKVDISGIWYPTEVERSRIKAGQRFDGHAMCVIGYNDNINNGSFEVMNSWGTWSGNKGLYWVSYDDFYDFVMEVYSIVDFDEAGADETPVPAKIENPVVIKPVIETPQVTPQPQVKVAEEIKKPVLKGDMIFSLLKQDGSFEDVAVNKHSIGSNGQKAGGNEDPSAYANFALAKPFYSGSKYKVKLNLTQPAYVYIIGNDKNGIYNLFPQKKYNESALIGPNNATLFLPSDSSHYTLDNVTGKEKMCVLVSKSPIYIDGLSQVFKNTDNNLYQAVRKILPKRLLEMKAVNYSNDKVHFNTEVNEENVLAFFIEMEHL